MSALSRFWGRTALTGFGLLLSIIITGSAWSAGVNNAVIDKPPAREGKLEGKADFITFIPEGAVAPEIEILFKVLRNADSPGRFINGYFRKSRKTDITAILPKLNMPELEPVLKASSPERAQSAARKLLNTNGNYLENLPEPKKYYAAVVILEALQHDGYNRREQKLQRSIQNNWKRSAEYIAYEESILARARDSLAANKEFMDALSRMKNPALIASAAEAEEQYYLRRAYFSEISHALFEAYGHAPVDILLAAPPEDLNSLRGLSWKVPDSMAWPEVLPRNFMYINYAPGDRNDYLQSWDREIERSTRTIVEETIHKIHNNIAADVLAGVIPPDDVRYLHGIGYLLNGVSKAVINQEACGAVRKAIDEGRDRRALGKKAKTCFLSQADYRAQYRERYAKAIAKEFIGKLLPGLGSEKQASSGKAPLPAL